MAAAHSSDGGGAKSATIRHLALFVEALRRIAGVQAYAGQLQAGVEMARGRVVDMATGEGKTYAAACAATLLGLSGRTVHVATPNPYLAARDQQALRLCSSYWASLRRCCPRVGSGLKRSRPIKRQCYTVQGTSSASIFFATNCRKYAHDLPVGERSLRLLRGSDVGTVSRLQGKLDCALIDEIDSVLIDEACMPLVLSEDVESGSDARPYQLADALSRTLVEGPTSLSCGRASLNPYREGTPSMQNRAR